MSIFDLTSRVAIVTGGNGGIGLGIAQALAAAGCSISIWGRNAENNDRGGRPGHGRFADLRRHRRRFGQGGDGRHA
jgi:NAD(P)-dependent dehydrogenase (short-subunit alcohol dehydrogenase family)